MDVRRDLHAHDLALSIEQQLLALVDRGAFDDRVRFGDGAAGIVWALAHVGAQVPASTADHLAGLVAHGPSSDVGLVTGLSGAALALDGAGRHVEAGRAWRQVEAAPMGRLNATVADGLAGVGLALLERTPVPDAAALLARIDAVTRALVHRLTTRTHRPSRPGILHGGSGPALYLLHAYDLTHDPSLLPVIERALRDDLLLLGWSPTGPGRPLQRLPLGGIATGISGIAMVLHEAARYLDQPWLAAARDDLADACTSHIADAGVTRRAVAALMALEYIRPAVDRRGDPALERLRTVPHAAPNRAASESVPVITAVTALLASHYAHSSVPARVAFFW
ncbi:hypothetical protein [Georgenia sp. SYP-B2076]|uniref:hypothetical protein n=1 Tax=Georgenia sp. SYP-B2076 TaxID=2495881 RepID=UPI000F8CAC65|nr:hypothetical protein [Georgenia sp. SYP-B2076]